MSSAICIFHGWDALISSLIHWISDQALGSSASWPPLAHRGRAVPAQPVDPGLAVSQESTLLWMNWRIRRSADGGGAWCHPRG